MRDSALSAAWARQMKRILIITPFVPSNRTAGQNYTLRLVQTLSDQHQVDLCLFHYPAETPPLSYGKARVLRALRTSAARMFACALKLPFMHPIFSSRFRIDLLLFLLKNRSAYDYMYFDFSQMFVYSLLLPKVPSFLMVHDVVTQLFGRKKGFMNRCSATACSFWEGFILRHSKATVLCFSKKDQELIQKYSGRDSIVVDFFIDEKIGRISYHAIRLKEQLCFYGAWHRSENSEGLVWFINSVLPNLDNGLQLIVMGGGLSKTLAHEIGSRSNVTYMGFVDNPFSVIAESRALLAPLFAGAGVKVKVVEALACGTPVIGSPVAFEGIDFADNLPVLCCDSIEEYLAAIKTVLSYTLEERRQFKSNFDSVYPRKTFDRVLSEMDQKCPYEAKAARRALIP
jgi:glycosyltransferase involved in cell wall biosynthesis